MPLEVQSNCRIVLYNKVWDLTRVDEALYTLWTERDTLRLTNIGLR